MTCLPKEGKMDITYETDDFRKYEPELVEDRTGTQIEMTLCEELDPESGRWEPFYVTRKRDSGK